MCIACPAKVLSVNEGYVEVIDAVNRQRKVKCPIDAKAGDHVIIGMGYAIEKISREDFESRSREYAEAMS